MGFDNEYRRYFPEQKIFISRDHNWAFSAWEIGRIRNYIKPGATVVHIDGHLDYLDSMCEIEQITTEREAVNFGRNLGIDEFIMPAQKTGTVGKVLMISNDAVDISEEVHIERAYTLNHYEHVYRSKWFDDTEGNSVILDFDLDFFNHNYQDWDCNPVLLPDANKKSIKSYEGTYVGLGHDYCSVIT